MRAQLRRGWLAVHRWIGLTAGLLFVLIGLTGSLLVFDHAIDEWLNPALLLSESQGARLPLGEITARAEAAYATRHHGWTGAAAAVSAPRIPNGVWTAWFQSGTEEVPVWTMVYVDPVSGRVTGERVWGENLMGVVYRLHYTLLGGDAGEAIVGVAGLVLMLSIASGVALWSPLWKSGWWVAFAVRRGRRFQYDLHKAVGVGAAPVLLVVAFSGVAMIFPDWVRPVVECFSPLTPPIEGLRSSAGERRLSPEQAVTIAKREFPDATFDHFHPPQTDDGPYEVGLRQPGEPQTSFGTTQVWIDARSGAVLATRNPKTLTAGDAFLAWQFPLHNGEAFGLPGRLLIFASGLTPAVLYLTGLILWWRRRNARRAGAHRRGARDRASRSRPFLRPHGGERRVPARDEMTLSRN